MERGRSPVEENQEIRSAALDLDTLKTRAARCVCANTAAAR